MDFGYDGGFGGGDFGADGGFGGGDDFGGGGHPAFLEFDHD